ncbi:MAG: aminoglycoside adenylyltransferase domain-containing protein [Micrococcaceae bacterium]
MSLLLGVSGWSGHTSTFPEAAGRRPLELTVVTLDDVQERSRWPRRDFQYGEWMRGDLVDGFVPQPGCDPDLVILFATALESHLVLHGQPLEEVLPPVPRNLLQQAQLEILPELLDGFDGDERNVLLTLARMIVTTESGTILPKHEAVERILPRLNQAEAELLILARDEYLGKTRPDWSQVHDDGFDVAQSLRRLILNVADFS